MVKTSRIQNLLDNVRFILMIDKEGYADFWDKIDFDSEDWKRKEN